MATVHLILNAHIDPVWLWPWQAGVDEVIATCRSACDRLDRHSDITFTRGEAWAYSVVERIDPPLFRRIVRHIEDGRWEIAGGWWIQPDCNLPTALGLARQIEIGRDYFISRFGRFPRVGYNVDSFGHGGFLPRLLNDHGQDRYVMMRPQEHELSLPARLFTWRGADGSSAVTAFRIARNYETVEITRDHVLASLENLPAGARHTLCFIGLGDHGGGPTERQITWCREHAGAFDGHRLEFSSLSRFFDAVEADGTVLPLVEGELQQHAPGCYSVGRGVKTGVRQAEHALAQAEITTAADPAPDIADQARLTEAWRWVCFNQFHDTLGGAAIASAYGAVQDQLGAAKAAADEVTQFAFRRRLATLPGDRRQRIALFNASDHPFDGPLTLAPWTEARWQPHWRVVDERGAALPYQLAAPEALTRFGPRVHLRVAIAAGALVSLFIDRNPEGAAPAPPAGTVGLDDEGCLHGPAVAIRFAPAPSLQLGGLRLTPEIVVYEDHSDTWSHGVEHFSGARIGTCAWLDSAPADDGPLVAACIQNATVEDSRITAEWRVTASDAAVELILTVDWRARQTLMKLELALPGGIAGRTDGVMGGALDRGLEARERPLQDFTLARLTSGDVLGIVCPDVFAIDMEGSRLRLTLLRSPYMAHHDPVDPAAFPRRTVADQGTHRFRFQFLAGPEVDVADLERRAMMIQRPPLISDWTSGMLARSDW